MKLIVPAILLVLVGCYQPAMAQSRTDAALCSVVQQDQEVKQVEVLAFTAPWCEQCQKDKAELKRLRGEGYVIREINVDDEPELAKEYGVIKNGRTKVPQYVVLENGVEVRRTESVSVLGTILIAALFWIFCG